ncbi:hypothetical protein FNF27_01926 [Cafeteria roenbergensis]|uniref:Uncharacterized protein n=1 Tax=Cafeteria roenbergensis TaxID=33653 RepID=A0A5A8EFI4_CAFRO|nr:hypothetical protein FNF27_01926 [Cafeteria roenbergensis]|mmetsp:Transcript_20392/g.78359  ORF Transcript_20392/g.78359 Transcript_20392/m.78359 type:complete len:459 (+) Transcript_20392:83-1459(+)
MRAAVAALVLAAAVCAAQPADQPSAVAVVREQDSVPASGLPPTSPAEWVQSFYADTLGVPLLAPDGSEGVGSAGPAPTSLLARPRVGLVVQTAPHRAARLRAAAAESLTTRGAVERVSAVEAAWPQELRLACSGVDAAGSIIVKGAKATSRHGPSPVDVRVVGACARDELRWANSARGFVPFGAKPAAGSQDAESSFHGPLACNPAGRAVLEALGASPVPESGPKAAAQAGRQGCGSFAVSERGAPDRASRVHLSTADPAIARGLAEAAMLVLASSRAAALAAQANGSATHALPAVLHLSAGQLAAKDPAADAALTRVLAAALRSAVGALQPAAAGRVAVALVATQQPTRGAPPAQPLQGTASRAAPVTGSAGVAASRLLLAGAGAASLGEAGNSSSNGTALTEGLVLQETITTFTAVGLIVTAIAAVYVVMLAGFEPMDRRLVARLVNIGSERAHAE